MARPLDVNKVKARIKENKEILKNAKNEVTEALKTASKDFTIDGVAARKALADAIKATQAISADNAKLAETSAQ